MKLSIIITAFNEEKTILKILQKLEQINISKEIIVVDDCSSDNTLKILEYNKFLYNKLVKNIENRGKGFSFREGLKHAHGEYVIIQDADLEYDPVDIKKIYNYIIQHKQDAVYGSRILDNRNIFNPTYRKYINIFLTKFSNFFNRQKLSDAHTCYKCVKTSILKKINLESEKFELCPEITTKLSNEKVLIKEIPIQYNGRLHSEGKKIKLLDGFQAIWSVIKFKFLG